MYLYVYVCVCACCQAAKLHGEKLNVFEVVIKLIGGKHIWKIYDNLLAWYVFT